MAGKIKLMVDGVEREVTEVTFEIIKEPWSEYEMYDGGRIRLRHILQRLFVVVDENGVAMNNAEGDPWVVVRAMPVAVVATR